MEFVYLVRQNQPMEDYYNYTIAVYDNIQEARTLARKLNKEFGKGCKFTKTHDFVSIIDSNVDDDYHYYDIDVQKINPALKDFMLEENNA